MYEKYLLQLEEAGKIRNLKERSINCYKNYVSYFLNYMEKVPEELTCQDVRDFLLAKKDDGLKATTLNLYNSAIRFFYRNVLHILWDDITVPRMMIEHKLPTVLSVDEVVVLCQEKVQIKHELFTLIFYFVSMLLQFLNVLISASTSFHIHLAKCIRSDYVFLLYYKMPLCIQI